MTTEDQLSLIRYVLDRFVGYAPEERMLRFAIDDWRSEMNHRYKDSHEQPEVGHGTTVLPTDDTA
jgi:hypothetical protein